MLGKKSKAVINLTEYFNDKWNELLTFASHLSAFISYSIMYRLKSDLIENMFMK